MFSFELLINALVIGILLGGFYAALSIGLSISFGLLDIVNIAHPAFIILGAFVCFIFNSHYGFDPILVGIVFCPVFFILGTLIYRIYYGSFEKTGAEALRGLAFFFGVMFIIEVILIMSFGVDFQMVQAGYIDFKATFGVVDIPFRMFVPFVFAMLMAIGLQWFSSKTFFGRAMQAVAQDSLALRLMGIDPAKIKTIAFGISIATCSIAGALLVIVLLVELGILFLTESFSQMSLVEYSKNPSFTEKENTKQIGELLYTYYFYLFQISGIILLVAMIGSITLTLRDRGQVKRQNISVQNTIEAGKAIEKKKVKLGEGI